VNADVFTDSYTKIRNSLLNTAKIETAVILAADLRLVHSRCKYGTVIVDYIPRWEVFHSCRELEVCILFYSESLHFNQINN
jgi:hypothetical protein